jgi:tRNA-2-methylthio-N6-dimethylallyladenosine synthase
MAGNLFHIVTYGCQMNDYDSQRLAGLLERDGFYQTQEIEAADLILFNTCSVRETAEKRLFGKLWEIAPLKRNNPDLIIGICGCMGQQYGKEMLKKIPHVDLVMGPRQIPQISSLVRDIRQHGGPLVKTGFADPYIHDDIVKREDTITAYMSIMEGCNHRCSFCIVPTTRGDQVNRPFEDILLQATRLAEKGYKEIYLLGQTVDAWRADGKDFADLLKAIDQVQGIQRIRFTSPHPVHITQKVLETIKESAHICDSFHLPLQSGNNRVLKAMKRGYTIEKYMEIIQKIKELWPDAGLTTDLITAFPTETQSEYEETLNIVREVGYDNAFCFMYSPREGTEAARMEGLLPLAERKQRVSKLVNLQKEITLRRLKERVGKTYEVLVEGPSNVKPGQLIGRTKENLFIAFPKKEGILPGTLVKVKAVRNTAYILVGEIVSGKETL